jgi:hypothetical protein
MNGDNQQAAGQPLPTQPMPTQPLGASVSPAAPTEQTQEVSWTASEFVQHEKNANWYGLLTLAAIALASIAYLFTRDVMAIVAITLVALIFGYVAGRPPRVLDYHLDRHGLTIAHKMYPYGSFKSFSVIDEGAFSSITLMSLRRFMPPLSIYFVPDDEQKIIGVLGQHLPMAPPSHDLIDRFMRFIKF